MKRLVVYALSGLAFVLYACRSLPSEYRNAVDSDFVFGLYSHVKSYYRANLKYPSIDELKDFCWEIVNEANDNKFSSFYDFEKAIKTSPNNMPGSENLLRHLFLYKNELSFKNRDKSMDIFWKGKKCMKIKFDLEQMIKERSGLFTYFYKSSGDNYKDFDYEDDFYKMRKQIRDKYLIDSGQKIKYQLCLLRYDKDKGYQVYYPSNKRVKQNTYHDELKCFLDTFLLNRNTQMIQFVTNLPENYLVKQ